MTFKSVFLDTNILVAAVTPSRRYNVEALRVLENWPQDGYRLCVSGQVLREYLVVSTRSRELNGLELSLEQGLANITSVLEVASLLPETEAVFTMLRRLLAEIPCRGKTIHDAQVAATALAHGVTDLLTLNPAHFSRFHARLKTLSL